MKRGGIVVFMVTFLIQTIRLKLIENEFFFYVRFNTGSSEMIEGIVEDYIEYFAEGLLMMDLS